MSRERDPGDAVPPGVAVETPAPLTAEDEQIREQLEALSPSGEEETPDEIDADIEREARTVQPHSAAPSRAGISGSGSGADDEGL